MNDRFAQQGAYCFAHISRYVNGMSEHRPQQQTCAAYITITQDHIDFKIGTLIHVNEYTITIALQINITWAKKHMPCLLQQPMLSITRERFTSSTSIKVK